MSVRIVNPRFGRLSESSERCATDGGLAGWARLGPAWRGMARHGEAGKERPGEARHGTERTAGVARRGLALPGADG